MSTWHLWLCAVLLIGTGMAADVPFVFGENTSGVASYTSTQLEQAHISSPYLVGVPLMSMPADNKILEFPVTGGGNNSQGKTEKKVADLKKVLNSRVEPNNPIVHDEALLLSAKHPGDYTVEQVSAIYSYLKEKWHYVPDPRGIDYFNYANESLKVGKDTGCAGAGDCDDFAILMSALVESIGGTTRVILAHNNTTGGHAYTEVYLGKLDDQNSQVESVINWLKLKYDTSNIFTHIDTDTRDVWLNLDWSANHPGGPYYQGDMHIVIRIRDNIPKTSLIIPEGFIKRSESESWRVKGSSQYDNGNYNDALEYYNKSIEIDPSFDRAWYDKGLALNKKGKYLQAIPCFEKAIEINSSNDYYWYAKGSSFYGLGMLDRAIQDYDKATEINWSNVNAWYAKGGALFSQGNYEKAVEYCDKVIYVNPNYLDAWIIKGEALHNLNRDTDAVKCYDKALELDPKNIGAWHYKGDSLQGLGKYEEAIACYDNVLKIDPSYANSWYAKGKAFEAIGRNSESDAAFAEYNKLRQGS